MMCNGHSKGDPVPEGCPRNRLFGSVVLSCHPLGAYIVAYMSSWCQKDSLWSSSDSGAKDVAEYVAACSVCARSKASRQARMGLLQPIPVPHRPWSHISLDFVTGLPPSKGNTVVLTVVDHFSKMTHFIPLTKLPSAKETAQVMIAHVLRIHGLPTGVPSLYLGFGRSFVICHPESNGQTERLNQELETCLRCLVAQNQMTWSDHLTWVEYAHNC
ncbi:hypothetical protein L3Q82_005348 [Scortum barcoo]|uniref:Uncharacterized protein n=1 Tax=Scortum barcoo TaxID=214431 RepID=A0ACB8V9R5_9TELE|nr:hypothetical protein L3Q82_005348 [Scortum barcoo]